MAFEPETRRETVIYIKASGGRKGNVTYRRSRYSFVEYDGSPDRFIEPVSMNELGDALGVIGVHTPANRGLVKSIERYDQNPLAELHDFSDSGF